MKRRGAKVIANHGNRNELLNPDHIFSRPSVEIVRWWSFEKMLVIRVGIVGLTEILPRSAR